MARNLPDNWFYMAQDVAMGKLKEVLQNLGYSVQYWEEAGVIEVELGEKTSIDIEMIDTDLGDDYSNAFVAEHAVTSVYYISFRKEDYEICMDVLKKVRNTAGGLICGDTEDFLPIFA